MGNSTISMAILNSYVKLPEGTFARSSPSQMHRSDNDRIDRTKKTDSDPQKDAESFSDAGGRRAKLNHQTKRTPGVS